MTKQKHKEKALLEQIRYWKNKVLELEKKCKSHEDYLRGIQDTLYYVGGK